MLLVQKIPIMRVPSHKNIDAVIAIVSNIILLKYQHPPCLFSQLQREKEVTPSSKLSEIGFSESGILYVINIIEEVFKRKIEIIQTRLLEDITVEDLVKSF